MRYWGRIWKGGNPCRLSIPGTVGGGRGMDSCHPGCLPWTVPLGHPVTLSPTATGTLSVPWATNSRLSPTAHTPWVQGGVSREQALPAIT